MKRVRYTGDAAVNRAVFDLINKFEYPDAVGGGGGLGQAGGEAGMAHVLIVSDSEPQSVQDKADFIVPASSSASFLQSIFDDIASRDINGSWSIWMAGRFELDDDVTAPEKSWIRGLGYTGTAC